MACVKGEITNLLAIMRFVPDFCPVPDLVSPRQHINAFKSLFEALLVCSDIRAVDFWTPFLSLIQAPDVLETISGVALSSVHKFLLYGFLAAEDGETLNRIVESVVKCTMPVVYSSSEEVVLMKLLHVFLECLKSPVSDGISDVNMWAMFQMCFEVFEKGKMSELLKKTVQNTMLQMLVIVFRRLGVPEVSQGYGIPCLMEILKHLSMLIGWSDKEDPLVKEKRCLGLFLLNTCLETAGESIGNFDELVRVIQDNLCKSLLVNSMTDDLFILSLTLRVVFNLFMSVKRHLKVQLEVFFNSIHLKIAGNYEDTQDPSLFQRSELALESIIDFCREPSLILELYSNYDCDMHFANLFETLAKFLCKHAYPLNKKVNRLNELCIEGLQAILTSIAMRCSQTEALPPAESSSYREQRALKGKVMTAAEVFNASYKTFIPKLQEMGLLPKPADAVTVARFLKENPAVDKDMLGEYLGKPDDFNKEVLYEFINLFDLSSFRIDMALKTVNSAFRMPGEAQIIARYIEAFSSVYYKAHSDVYADETAAYILAYSIIQLNTDLHNPGVKFRMTVDDYIRNVRGTNGKKDFPRDMLEGIYENIKNEEIKVYYLVHHVDHAELEDPAMADNKWEGILSRAKMTGNYSMLSDFILHPAGENEKDMFDILWESGILGAFLSVLECAEEPKAFKSIISVIVDMGKICAYFSLSEHITKMFTAFAHVVLRAQDSVLLFKEDKRAWTALEVLIRTALATRNSLTTAWQWLVAVVLKLHSLQILPQTMVELDDFIDAEGRLLPCGPDSETEQSDPDSILPEGSKTPVAQIIEEQLQEEATGIWSSFTRILGIQSAPQRKPEEIVLRIREELRPKVKAIGLPALFGSLRTISPESLDGLLKALTLFSRESPVEFSVILSLELLTNTVLSAYKQLSQTQWTAVTQLLDQLIRSEDYQYKSERAFISLLRIAIRYHEEVPALEDALLSVLQYLTQIPAPMLSKFAERVAAGLLILVRSSSNEFVTSSACSWKTLLGLLQRLLVFESSCASSFEILTHIIQEIPNLPKFELTMFEETLELVLSFIKRADASCARISQGISLIFLMYTTISTRYTSDITLYLWKHVIAHIGKLCQEHRRDLRVRAYGLLQDIILGEVSSHLQESWDMWKDCFEHVLFPLVIEPFVITKDMLRGANSEITSYLKAEYEQSRERAVGLICKAFLSKLRLIRQSTDFYVFWMRLIKLVSQTVKQGDEVNERTYEIIKNLLLVLKTEEEYPPEVWIATWEQVGLPTLRQELEPVPEVQVST